MGRFLQTQRGKLKNTEIYLAVSILEVHLILIQTTHERTKQRLRAATLSLCLTDTLTGITVSRLWYNPGVQNSKGTLINCRAFGKEPPGSSQDWKTTLK